MSSFYRYLYAFVILSLLATGAVAVHAQQPDSLPVPKQVDDLVDPPMPATDVPYVPTPQPVVEKMLEAAGVTEDDVVYDLGSGDGRIVITAAKEYGARGVGIDIDPQRIKEARRNAEQAGVTDLVSFQRKDLFETDLRDATVVTLYLLPSLNEKLRPKLFEELKPGTPVVSHDFDMGEWEPERVIRMGGDTVYLWYIPEAVPEHLAQ